MITTSYAAKQSQSAAMHFAFTEYMLLMNAAGTAEKSLFDDMLKKEKRQYVLTHHKQAISQLHSSNPYKDGALKTHIYADGKRKTIQRKTEEELYEYLYIHYQEKEGITTFEDVFNMFIENKKSRGRTNQTISEDQRRFGYLDSTIM